MSSPIRKDRSCWKLASAECWKNGYRIKSLNTINFKKSMHYNPFAYIHSEKDILKLVTTHHPNTKGEGKGGDDFWVKSGNAFYCALIGYICYEAPVGGTELLPRSLKW